MEMEICFSKLVKETHFLVQKQITIELFKVIVVFFLRTPTRGVSRKNFFTIR